MLRIGIAGLANVGKSTLFNALTHAGVLAANYPFATIEPNTGVVAVPDERLEVLAKMYSTEKIVPATVSFTDIAGLIAGASKGEGLGNKFLANIREMDAICHVVRAFGGSDVVRVGVNEKEDISTVNTELALADMETLEKYLPKLQRETKSGGKGAVAEYEKGMRVLEKIRAGEGLGAGENVAGLQLLTSKPVIYMFNVDEKGLADGEEQARLAKMVAPEKAVFVNAKLESEMTGMTREERREFLASYGASEDGLGQLVRAAYETLGLQSFLTAGEKEVRAWTVRRGATAPEAAGVIHTDFERGFVAAAVCKYEDLVRLGSEKAVREAGLMRTEGKGYVVAEGDVVEFRVGL